MCYVKQGRKGERGGNNCRKLGGVEVKLVGQEGEMSEVGGLTSQGEAGGVIIWKTRIQLVWQSQARNVPSGGKNRMSMCHKTIEKRKEKKTRAAPHKLGERNKKKMTKKGCFAYKGGGKKKSASEKIKTKGGVEVIGTFEKGNLGKLKGSRAGKE